MDANSDEYLFGRVLTNSKKKQTHAFQWECLQWQQRTRQNTYEVVRTSWAFKQVWFFHATCVCFWYFCALNFDWFYYSTMDNDKLISLVYENRCLWDMSDKNYHNRYISRLVPKILKSLSSLLENNWLTFSVFPPFNNTNFISGLSRKNIDQVRPSLLGSRNVMSIRISKNAYSVTTLFLRIRHNTFSSEFASIVNMCL